MKRKSNRKHLKNQVSDDEEFTNGNSEEPVTKKSKPSKGKRKSRNENLSKNLIESDGSFNNDNDNGGEYEVEAVLDEKKIRGIRHYLIRWKGYEPESDTWEPESTLDCPDLIKDFRNKRNDNNKHKKSKKDKKYNTNQPEWDENENFEVDRIIDVYFKRNGSREFLVSWKGYPSSANSWEPEENMDCKEMIERFMDKVKKAQQVDVRELRTHRTHTDRFTLSTDVHGRRLSKRHQGKQRVQYHDAE